MKYYKNANGKTAKLLYSATSVIIMFDFTTMFFDDLELANTYLKSMGFYRR